MFFEIFSFGTNFYAPYMLSPRYENRGLDLGYFYFGRSHISARLINVPESKVFRCHFSDFDPGLLVRSGDGASYLGTNRRLLPGRMGGMEDLHSTKQEGAKSQPEL
jgi:hypothetical protein